MRIYKIVLLFISVFYNEVLTLNILGVFPYEGKSHFFVFKPYLEELARRGHNVTVISYFPQKQQLQNYTDISLADKSEILEDVFSIYRSYWGIFQIFLFLTYTGNKNCKVLLEDESVQNLWKSESKFDVVITEQFNSDCALGLAYKLGAPVVGITSHTMMPGHFPRFGISYNPSYVSLMFLEGGTKPSLYQRIERPIMMGIGSFLFKYISQRNDQATLAQYFDDIPPLEELGRDIKYMLLYTNFVLNGAMLYPPNVIEVGGYHVAKPKPLPEDLRKYIEESEHGVVYVSFGSMLRAASTPRDKIEAIVGAISKLPQRIIWKWEETSIPGDAKNVYLSNWLPQNDILAHPNVIGFYSHCGLLGTTEAMYHGVPMICMPVFGDQPANAAAVEESGLGIQIQVQELSTPTLLEKFKIILNPDASEMFATARTDDFHAVIRKKTASILRRIRDSNNSILRTVAENYSSPIVGEFMQRVIKFRSKVTEISKIWHDRPVSPMDSAIYWTEFAARTSNFTFRSASTTVPTYQYFYLDLLAVLTGVALIALFLTKLLFTILFSKPKQLKKKVKTK